MLIQQLLGTPGQELCAVYHWRGPHAPAIVICSGIASSMSEPRYLLSILARQCHELGLNVFQYDYLGDGDSAGDYTDISVSSLLESAQRVIAFVESLGCSQLGLVGYGIGNIVASFLVQHPTVDAIALLSPQFSIFSGQGEEVWNELAQCSPPGLLEPAYSRAWHASTPLDSLWRATVGETPADLLQFGRLNAPFLWQLRTLRPQAAFLRSDKPLLVISERDDDALHRAGPPVVFEPIRHSPTPGRPFWHWCVECREHILARLTDWFRVQFPPADQDLSPPGHLAVPAHLRDCRPKDIPRRYSLTIEVEGQSVLGILHVPPATANPKRICVIYEPGLPGNRVDVHCNGPRLAQALMPHGLYLFRYDSRGTGVSAGEFHEFTWTSKRKDLKCVMDHLVATADIEHFVILSNSAGGKIACWAANRDQRVCGSVLWGPILVEEPDALDVGVVRRHSSGSLVTDFCCLWLGVKYNVDERRYDFLGEFETCRKPCLIMFASDEPHVTNRETILPIASEHPEKSVREISGKHGFEPETIMDAINSSVDWLVALAASLETDQSR